MKYLNIKINDTQPHYINDFSLALLDGFYLKEGEDFNKALARTATAFCYGDYELAQRLYDAAFNGWFMFASPILSNAPKGVWKEKVPNKDWKNSTKNNKPISKDYWDGQVSKSMPISCFALVAPDSIIGQMDAGKEAAALSVAGGGVGIHNQIRAITSKAPGPIPYMKMLDATVGYYRQGETRRGAFAYYMDIDHPDIVEHIKFRLPSGGDSARKSDNRKQFHNAVNITDKFIDAVLKDLDWELKCPHSGEVRETLKARALWEEILETRALTGEPYIFKIDTANRALPKEQKDLGLKVNGSNICVTPETPILTDKGYFAIKDLENQSVNVWNGESFTSTIIKKTGDFEHVIRVQTSKGQWLDCTPLHRFYVVEGYGKKPIMKYAHQLKPGDKLEKCKFPIIDGELILEKAYTNGFFSGDGCQVKENNSRIYLYGKKRKLKQFIEISSKWIVQEDLDREYADRVSGLQYKYFVPNATYTIKNRLEWLAGLLDADGTVCINDKSETIQLGSINKDFLCEVQLMLHTLGVDSNISLSRVKGTYLLPANDGTGKLKEYNCKEVNRLLISTNSLHQLYNLGLRCNRLKITGRKPQRNASYFNTVESVSDYRRVSDVYCFTEQERNKGVFAGILTGQCIEIALPTNEERTFVCCLSSLNLELYDEWKDTTLVEDLTRFLDNVIQYFIDNASDTVKKAKFSAYRERAIGIGTMGWAYYLQKNNIPFESGGFNSSIQHTHLIYKNIKEKALSESIRLAEERGESPDMIGSGRRNSHLLAIAPNSNNGIILNTSPSIEPISRNAYTHSTRAGSFLVKNKYLDKLLKEINSDSKWLEEQWNSIISHNGSVKHLEYLSDKQKEIFKTAFEIDQHWVIEQADARQQYICQSQSLNLFFPSGVDRTYFNSVHLKGLTAQYVKSMYYSRMERGVNADTVKEIERKAIKDWSNDECVACSG